MIRVVLFVSVVMCYHASGEKTVSSAMQAVESEDDNFQMLYQKIVDMDAKMTAMETAFLQKDMELENQISELELNSASEEDSAPEEDSVSEEDSASEVSEKDSASEEDVIENNVSSSLEHRRRCKHHCHCKHHCRHHCHCKHHCHCHCHCKHHGRHHMVAFYATLRADSTGYLVRNKIIRFDNVVTNYGGGYRPGYFFAPISGTYVFSVSVGEMYGKGTYYITANNVIRGRLQVGAAGYQASQTVVIYLRKGNHVSVKNGYCRYDKLKGNYQTSFSGFLLH